MDPHRFDRLSKAIANRLTRRQMLGGLGAGGLAASLLGDAPSLAESGGVTCVYDFDGTIGIGPSSTLGATSEIVGELTITLGPDGAIDSGKLVKPNGESWNVVGQAAGRAINLRFSVPKTGAFIAVGTGRHDIANCTVAMSGPASGPLRGDAGSWTATLKSSGANASSPTATVGTVPAMVATAGSSTTGAPTQPADDAPTADATGTSACDIECGGDTLGRDPDSCTCLCAAGLASCTFEIGSIPAKGGVIFKTGPISTPRGFCIDLTTDASNCGACAQPCDFNSNMTSSPCAGGVCGYVCKPGFDTCPGDGPCLSALTFNNNHCGSCDTQCSPPLGCVDTHCVCVDNQCGPGNGIKDDCTCICNNGLTACGFACVDTNTDPDNCGSCGNVCRPGERNCAAGKCYGVVAPSA